MAKATTFSNGLLKLMFNGTAITGLAINATSSPVTNFYLALHTADPTASGDQATSEVTYTGYARVAVARTTGGWVVTDNSVSPVATVTFPAGTGGSGIALYCSIGVASSGTGAILYTAVLTPGILLGSGITPALSSGTTFTEN